MCGSGQGPTPLQGSRRAPEGRILASKYYSAGLGFKGLCQKSVCQNVYIIGEKFEFFQGKGVFKNGVMFLIN